jgi:hypothetical protein
MRRWASATIAVVGGEHWMLAGVVGVERSSGEEREEEE